MNPCPTCKCVDPAKRGIDRHKPGGHQTYCFKCNAKRAKAWREKNPKTVIALNREKRVEWLGVTHEKPVTRATARNRVIRSQVLAKLGGKCACCGETRDEFLTVDHIHGGGNKHRTNSDGYFYRVLLRTGLPESEYRVLCYNCNCARGHRGYCPHERERAL